MFELGLKGNGIDSLQHIRELDDISLLSECPITDIEVILPSKGETASLIARHARASNNSHDDVPYHPNHLPSIHPMSQSGKVHVP